MEDRERGREVEREGQRMGGREIEWVSNKKGETEAQNKWKEDTAGVRTCTQHVCM